MRGSLRAEEGTGIHDGGETVQRGGFELEGNTSRLTFSDEEAAQALAIVLGDNTWEAVALAHGFLAMRRGVPDEEVARTIFSRGAHTLKRSRELAGQLRAQGLLALLTERRRIGSAENPVTKLFPARITEERFLELLDQCCTMRSGLTYSDDRDSGTLTDFTLREGELELPINIKNAGTRFERAKELVGLEPDDCIPIPAYKAYAALEATPNLIYVISVDYGLVARLDNLLAQVLGREEGIVWSLLKRYGGHGVQSAENAFIFSTTRKYWEAFSRTAEDRPFHVISARRAVRILQTKPQRTPGIGLKAWGTGANAEVNVHVSIREETTPWSVVRDRIVSKGIADILQAVNRKRVEEVYDPEI